MVLCSNLTYFFLGMRGIGLHFTAAIYFGILYSYRLHTSVFHIFIEHAFLAAQTFPTYFHFGYSILTFHISICVRPLDVSFAESLINRALVMLLTPLVLTDVSLFHDLTAYRS